MVAFLGVNGYAFDGTDEDVVVEFVALAAGDMSEDALVTWVRGHSAKEPR